MIWCISVRLNVNNNNWLLQSNLIGACEMLSTIIVHGFYNKVQKFKCIVPKDNLILATNWCRWLKIQTKTKKKLRTKTKKHSEFFFKNNLKLISLAKTFFSICLICSISLEKKTTINRCSVCVCVTKKNSNDVRFI